MCESNYLICVKKYAHVGTKSTITDSLPFTASERKAGIFVEHGIGMGTRAM